jgi:hypothetical protein
VSVYTIRNLTHSELICELEADRTDAMQLHGTGHFQSRSSEAIGRHNRMVRRCKDAGEITEHESDRLATRY